MVTLTKAQLSELKRPELQKICKDKGIKGGNQKKDILVDLILNHDTLQDDQLIQLNGRTDGKSKQVAVEVDGTEDDDEPAEPTASAPRGRSASSRQAASSTARPGTTTSRKAASTKPPSARAGRKPVAKRVDIVAIDDEEDDEQETPVAEEQLAEPQEAEPQPLESTDPSPLLPRESRPATSTRTSAAVPAASQPQPTASTSTSAATSDVSAAVAQIQSKILALPTQEQYSLLTAQVSSVNQAFETMSDLPRRVEALPTRAELEKLKRDMLARGWVRKEDVEAIVEERLSRVERRLAALEAGASAPLRSGSMPPSSAASQRVPSTSSLGKHPRSPTVTFASPQPAQTFGARLPSGGVGSGTPASSSAYGTLGLGFGQPGPSSFRGGGDGLGPSPKKARVVSGQSDMDVGLVDAMLEDRPVDGEDDPDRTLDEDEAILSPPSRSRSGTPHQDPLLTPPPRASPQLPDHSFTPKAAPPSAHRPTPPPMSSHALHTHHHPFDPTAGGSHARPSPFVNHSAQRDLPTTELPFPLFATSPRPPVIAPASPTLSVGWDSPRKTSEGGPSGAAQMSMSSASSTGGLTPGRALFTSATGPGGETPKAHGGRGTPNKRGASAPGVYGGVPGSAATLQGLVSGAAGTGGPGSVFRGGPLFNPADYSSKPNSSSSQHLSIFGAPLPLPPSITASSSTSVSSTSTPTGGRPRHVSADSSHLLPPLPLNAPFELSPAQAPRQPQPFPFPISPAPGSQQIRGVAQRHASVGRMPPPPTPPAQRTLFGTEREVDGRFGDDDE